ncbi:unnamed protein product [Psylliodes chrysocephalus]|uniref:Uncharacterized protein n=1 Tax=Psylliodes chrysocephalus TaxID=3402493 RepID=A0A9P0CL68_9CUCU|nr:unnamed protein product [Psylliodes chrysocephala]
MNDEKYFTFANPEIPGNSGFYTDNFNDCPDNVKFEAKAKFEDKIMVWCAISEAGVSRPYVGRVRGQAVDANVYTQNCLPKLLNFINLYHANDEIMFWPDLASCHYTHATRQWLEANHIPFVPREDNPPNVLQARPIESFWALLTRKIYDNGWEAQNQDQLRRRIYQKVREVDLEACQALMRQLRTKLRRIREHGPLSLLIISFKAYIILSIVVINSFNKTFLNHSIVHSILFRKL